ncbi:MAG: hypothetical protein Q7K16_02415 [Candidatus Azambacteria bacterium]|nr:hypothetical protein [Candidatus Azambacteria bacterium]
MLLFKKTNTAFKKIIFFLLESAIFILGGGFIGFTCGFIFNEFIPSECITRGINTVCQSSFQFLGVGGYEASSILGFIMGAIFGLVMYLVLVVLKNKKTALKRIF